MKCYYHDQYDGERICGLCKKSLCDRCINPEDGYCWSCSYDFHAGIHQEKNDDKIAIKRINEYLYCFLIYEFSYLLLSSMVGRLSPILFVFEAPYILIVGIPISILIEWVTETKMGRNKYSVKCIFGFALYLLSALLCTSVIFGLNDFRNYLILTISVSLSIFFILRIFRSNGQRSIIFVSIFGYLTLILLNLLTIN
ncbi:hypothetical protein H8B09_07590 [Paenibacillus sp. PR3]|uniref:B box-type domain-containing protein n=1 Tax=Paenibacillus terricola TaxID=2763503 RepID=A0ABR8MUD1_9BACL|nr:hypothetical protein [Paenibacillus terricola]MBD3918607.1 hypothetical protein [Paenibacillus terricola]